MGQPVISIKNTFYPNDADIKRLMAYISGKGCNKDREKVSYIGTYGTKKKHAKATEQMIKAQKYFGKSDKRRIYHMVVSFKDSDDPATVKRAAKAIAKEIFKE